MNNFKIGDRVKVISVPSGKAAFIDTMIIGRTGTVKELEKTFAGVEFDEYIDGHHGNWKGKYGYCWWVEYECLEKIDETNTETKAEVEEMGIAEETKTNTLEEKVLEVLREEIGVDIGEEFDVYKKGNMLWRCKFERNEFFGRAWNGFQKSRFWKDLIVNFHDYTFKRKPFIPEQGEDYFFLTVSRDENISLKRGRKTWTDDGVDYGMLALGNVFRSEKEALASKDKLLEKMKKLRKGE